MSNESNACPSGRSLQRTPPPSMTSTSAQVARPVGPIPADAPVNSKVSVLRGRRTRFANLLLRTYEDVNAMDDVTTRPYTEWKQLLQLATTRQAEIREVNDKLLGQDGVPETEYEREDEESFRALECAASCIAALTCALETVQRRNDLQNDHSATAGREGNHAPSPPPHTTDSGQHTSARWNTAPAAHGAAPPSSSMCGVAPLDIAPEVYGGEPGRFKQWWGVFQNWVDRRTNASDSDKFVVLQKHLRGAPRALLEPLDICDQSYATAVRLLHDNFGQPETQRKRALASLSRLPSVKSPYDVEGLRALLNHVQRVVMTLEGMGAKMEQYALTFEETLRNAIPPQLLFDHAESKRIEQLAVAASSNQAVSSANSDNGIDVSPERASKRIEELIDYLQRYVKAREGFPSREPLRQQNAPEGPSRHPSRGRMAASSFPLRTKDRSTVAPAVLQRGRPRPCLFCSSTGHATSRCTAPLTRRQRCDLLAKLKRCKVCFRDQHVTPTECPGTHGACRVCKSTTHYTCMHPDDTTSLQQQPGPQKEISATVVAPIATPQSLLMTASAFIVCGSKRVPIRLLADSGASVSFVKPSVIEQLPELRPTREVLLQLQTFSDQPTVNARRYDLRVVSTYDDSARVDIGAFCYDFNVSPSSDCTPEAMRLIRSFGKRNALADRSLLDVRQATDPVLLIGMENFYKLVYLNSERALGDGLVAKRTLFGWTISGELQSPVPQPDVARAVPVCGVTTLSKPARDISKLWTLDALGITETRSSDLTADEMEALRQFNESLQYDGHVYTVGMPKRESIASLANNLGVARDRLLARRRKLLRDRSAYEKYHAEIMMFVNEGYAEEVLDFDMSTAGEPDGTYVMPHHPVITRVDGREKCRIVFDCSSSAPGQTSLNAHLLNGPNLNADLAKLLINFRLHPTAVSADITRAYMMLHLAEEDRRYFRFLWQGPDDEKVRCYHMCRVTWGAAPSGFLLVATLREIFRRVDPTASHRLGDSLYYDDLLRSFPSDTVAVDFINKIIPWLGSAGMQLAKWKTSSSTVAAHLDSLGVPMAADSLVNGTLMKVLGISWSPSEDQFRFELARLTSDVGELKCITKRAVLRVVASVFDPLGWTMPYLIRGKLLVQQLWSRSLSWDQPVDEDLCAGFQGWAHELSDIAQLRIPRLYGARNKKVSSRELHIFGDASERAYACAAYLQTHYTDGDSDCALVMSKSRLAPREQLSMPRLELMAALISVRLRLFLTDRLAVKIDKVSHYTDSTVTYHWCTAENPTRWKPFIANRCREIQNSSERAEWFHLPGSSNIADFATRGVAAGDLLANQEWWRGPQWLALPVNQRPTTQPHNDNTAASEIVERERKIAVAPVVLSAPPVELSRFSSWEGAVRVVEKVLLFIQRCRKLPPSPPASLRSSAEKHLVRWTQAEHFAVEMAAVKSGERPPRSSKLASFNLFIDADSLLRAQTRLTQGPHFTDDEKCPIVIPGKSHLASLLVLHHHRANAHLGTNVILSAIRRKYWLTRGRQVIRAILSKCVVCRRQRGPSADQVRAPLPPERTSIVVPFASTGVDFCGPFYTRTRKDIVKNYVALFTCASTRAIWLELTPSMTTPQTHFAIRRFLAVHPGCAHMRSDNGRSFVRAAADLKQLFNSLRDPETRELLAQRRITWEFNCAAAPWRGGYWERLVGVVKAALTRTLGRSLVSSEELQTILVELSRAINDRPISYVSNDADEPRPITPAHFLHGNYSGPALCTLAPLDRLGLNGAVAPQPESAERLRTALLQRTNYFRSLAVRWYREYLLMLRSANLDSAGKPRPLRQGAVCLVRDDNTPRIRWCLVRVVDCHPGRDGAVRTYTVRFANGHQSRRAAQLLYPLEADLDAPSSAEDPADDDSASQGQPV